MQKKINQIIKEIEKEFDVLRINSITSYQSGGDIDFLLIEEKEMKRLVEYLNLNNFLVIKNPNRDILGDIYINGELYSINFYGRDYSINFLHPYVYFKEKFYKDIIQDPNLQRYFRYVLQLRNRKAKYIKFVTQNFKTYQRYLSDTTYLSCPIFKKNIIVKDLIGAMERNPFCFFRVFPPYNLLRMFLTVIKRKFNKIGKGKIIAFIGADGAGKTTAIKKTKMPFYSHVINMGDKSLWFPNLCDKMHKKNIFIARLPYIIIFIEHWCRYFKMIYFKIKGDLVFVDRWPGTNRHLRKNNIWKSVNTIMYAFFPDPDLYIFLFAPPEIISLRKTDLNTEEIKCLQKNIEKKITSKKHYKVKTVDIDLSLKKILIIIFKLIGTKIFN